MLGICTPTLADGYSRAISSVRKSKDDGAGMLEDKRQDLIAEKQKTLLLRMVMELSNTHGDLYYQPTSEIARQLKNHIEGDNALLATEKELLDGLGQRDIEIILSLNT